MSSIANEDLQATREKILRYLLFHRTSPDINKYCTAKEIARNLKISPNGVRHHLKQLEYEQLVKRTVRRGKTGRPATIYTFKDKAFNQFPKMYPEISKMLLEGIMDQYGIDAAVKLLEGIGMRIADNIKENVDYSMDESDQGVTIQQKVERLAKIFEDYGKFPQLIEEKGSYIIRNYNCLIYDISSDIPLACKIDETLIRELLGFTPVKESCIRDGAGYCQFRVKKVKGQKNVA
ncbi:MAG: helix-turn-helix transcriptional regulator [Candidatus Odinarchaeota archaeon]